MQDLRKFLTMTMALFFVPIPGRGQAPPVGAARTDHRADYSKEAFVIDNLRTVASFENEGTGTSTVTAQIRVQSEAGVQQWGVLRFGYSSAYEQVEIGYVRVRKADGSVVETPAQTVLDMTSEVTRVAPMYSDYREKHVAVKGLGVGDVVEYQLTTRRHTPLIPGQFWFAYDFFKAGIALDEEVEVLVPKGREVKVKSPGLPPNVTGDGSHRVYTWKTAHREREEDQEPPREIPPPDILVSTFKSWEEVGRWWNGLEQERVAPTAEVRAKAGELTRDAATREEKVRALYDYVATHFRYISISFGIGRYQPHAALEVLNNEYGDCKDKHTLLASLLAAVGVEAYPALINSTRRIDPDVPSPGQFDHVISAVPVSPAGSKLFWLDTTTEVAPFGLLAFNLRDKQALVIPGTLPALLVTTPADPPFKSFRSFEIDAKLSDAGVLEGKVQRRCRDDAELVLRALFRQVPQSQWKDLVQDISQATGFAGEVSEVEAGSPEATGEPFRISYKYTRKDYPDWANRRITPPLGFIGFPEVKDDRKRTQPILLGAPEEVTAIASVELPKGYNPRLLTGVDLTRDFAEYHSRYTFKDGVLVTEVRVVIKKREVPLSAVEDYKSFQKAVGDDLSRYTELTTASASAYFLSPSANPEVMGLVQQAREALQQRDLNGAVDFLERAVKLDDHYKDGWLMLASLHMAQGRVNEGLGDFRRAIEIDPKDVRSYKSLGLAYMRLRRFEEAVRVWRDLLKEDSNDKDARANLGSTLLTLKRYSEAVPELEAAVALNKPSSQLELELANAYLGAGDNEKAVAVYRKAAEMDLQPATWNNVAYALADHNLNLPDARRYAEKAVRSLEDDAARVSLDKLELADLERMQDLAYFWDTLGWVYFREGNLEKAGKYLEAAWNLEQTRVIGDHLAQVYEKQDKKAVARHQYALAQALPDLAASGQIAPPLVRRDGGYVAAEPGQRSAVEELSEMRRTKLGKLSAAEGSAEFFVLLAPGGKVEDVKFISGAEHLRSLSKAVGSLKFKAPLPDDAPTKLVRRGVLVCTGTNLGCDFTLFTPDSVHSTQPDSGSGFQPPVLVFPRVTPHKGAL